METGYCVEKDAETVWAWLIVHSWLMVHSLPVSLVMLFVVLLFSHFLLVSSLIVPFAFIYTGKCWYLWCWCREQMLAWLFLEVLYGLKSNLNLKILYWVVCDPMDCSLPGSSVHGVKKHKKKKKIFIYFNWRIISLQYCDDFCHTSPWISHKHTYVRSRSNS